MLKKILTALGIFLTLHSQAQTFYQSAGISGESVFYAPDISSYGIASVSYLNYYPRFNIVEVRNASLSVGSPLGIGVMSALNASFAYSDFYLAYRLPVALDFNFGRKSSPESESKMGGYVGSGFDWSQAFSGEETINMYGPLIRAGLRTPAGSKRGITIGLQYRIGLSNPRQEFNLSAFQMGVAFDF